MSPHLSPIRARLTAPVRAIRLKDNDRRPDDAEPQRGTYNGNHPGRHGPTKLTLTNINGRRAGPDIRQTVVRRTRWCRFPIHCCFNVHQTAPPANYTDSYYADA